ASGTLVKATHKPKPHDATTQRYSPRLAVDGSFDNRRFWQSGRGDDPKKRDWHKTIPLPAWLEVDMEQVRTVDHATIQFHHRPVRDSVDMVPTIIRYAIEVSKNGRKWTRVIDESANMKPLRRRPTTKWFDPIDARYARVTVLANSDRRGAQVVEFGVYGKDRESYVAPRRSPWPPERPWLPIEVQNWPASKQVSLADEDPILVRNRTGKNRQTRFSERTIRAHYDSIWGGHRYEKVLDVSAPHEVSYAVADGAQTFVAVGGFRKLYADRPGVIYRVFVDGQKRFDSGEYHGFDALPIVVDVRGARTLKVVVEDMRDGTNAHEALLAEPRFLLN
ncbi:MAG: NPCBM/NEW2 domain-containing protein, partial [Myxococcota bacterium]